jgi:dihydroneopterin aldolase
VRLTSLGRGRSWKLIETLAVEMAEMSLREFKPKSVTIEIKKFILPQTQHVAVSVTRPVA